MNENDVFKTSILDAIADQKSNPNKRWMIERPGTIQLLETDYRITYDIQTNYYSIHWGKNLLGKTSDLDHAKHYAINHMGDMINMGYDP